MQRVRIVDETLLSDNWYMLKKVVFRRRNRAGEWVTQAREVYDRGNGAAMLLLNRERGTVILTRQFRLPTYVNGNGDGLLIEACAGLLDGETPDAAIVREAEEETGYRVTAVRKIGEAYMSPGSVTELLHLYVAEYEPAMRTGGGGGLPEEHEDIEVLELRFREAMRMIETGEIKDGKTIMLLQYAALHRLAEPARPLHVLVAGPYRSGTGDDPAKIGRNMAFMQAVALQVYERGHLPVLGEWYALPLLREAGSKTVGDEAFDRIFHPSSIRLLARCDAVLRVGGPSEGADEMARLARESGLKVYLSVDELPALEAGN